MLKTKIYEDPKVTNEQLEDVLGLSNNTLASRLSRLRQVDPETTKYRIIPKTELSATSIDARTETMQRFVRGEISREDTLKQTSLGNDAFIKLLSRIRKRMGVSIISQEELERRKVVRQLAEGKITREDALKTGLSPVNLKSRVYELRKN